MKRDFQEISKTWHLLANSIRILKDTRVQIEKESKNYNVLSINSTLILTSAAVVEGAISSLLTHHLNSSDNYKQVKHKNDSEIERIYNDLLYQIQSAQWGEIIKLFKLITNYKLQQIYDENWEGIKYLFQFRNLLAHGGMIIRKVEKISDAEDVKNIQKEESF